LTEQKPQAFKQYGIGGNALHVNSTRRTPNPPFHALLLPAVPLFRLSTGASDEVQTDLPSAVAARIVVANGILETPGPPAFARGMLAHLEL
jgi:hypothetical protein